ncbi:TPA: hypothetical protein EYN65_07000, partial [Candidatus Poribacteria bacterium]|nr:hypothetical protein [Candidatus Poribacteria bacterium]
MVENILRQEFGSEDFQFKDITRGGRAFVFQVHFEGKDYVLRVCSQEQPIINNFKILKCLEGIGISPVPIQYNRWDDLHYSIESFLPGEHESHNPISPHT